MSLFEHLADEIRQDNLNDKDIEIDENKFDVNTSENDNTNSLLKSKLFLKQDDANLKKPLLKKTERENDLLSSFLHKHSLPVNVTNRFLEDEQIQDLMLRAKVKTLASCKRDAVSSTIGLLFDITDPKRSKSGKLFCKWKITDFRSEFDLLLFGDAIKVLHSKQIFAGVLVCLERVKRDPKGSALIVGRLNDISILSETKVYFCKKNGCKRILSSNNIKFCSYHLSHALQESRQQNPLFSSGLSYSSHVPVSSGNKRVLQRLREGKLKIRKLSAAESVSRSIGGLDKKKTILGSSNAGAVDWNAIRNKKSIFDSKLNVLREERMMKKLGMLEKKEKIQERMSQVKDILVVAYVCKECRLVLEKPLESCLEKKHILKTVKVKKRYFKCVQCKYATNTLNKKYPTDKCPKCRNVVWRQTNVYKI